MTKLSKTAAEPGVLVAAVEEVPRISDADRAKLRTSLGKARAEIAAGDYDELTPELLRAEFDAVYKHGKSDAEIDAAQARRSKKSRA